MTPSSRLFIHRHAPRLAGLAAFTLAAACTAAMAAPAAPAADSDYGLTADAMASTLARAFVLDKGLPLDASLRTAANAMSAAHLVRMRALLPLWLKEEHAQPSADGVSRRPLELANAVWARLLNDMALWHMEPGDADYERATLEVLKSAPRICDRAGDPRFSDFATRIMRVQAMPAPQRAAALENERRLLARWGQPWTAPPPWPEPLPQDDALAALRRAQAAKPRATLALAPVLASEVLAQRKDYRALHANTQCALQQWWLRESLRTGASAARALSNFRYGTLISASERFGPQPDSPPGDDAKPAYPALASTFQVTGTTTMRVRTNASGTIEQVSVAERKIDVPGIRGVRPLAFENIFDALTLAYPRNWRPDKPGAVFPSKLQLDWKLEPAATSPTGAKP